MFVSLKRLTHYETAMLDRAGKQAIIVVPPTKLPLANGSGYILTGALPEIHIVDKTPATDEFKKSGKPKS